MLTGVYGSQGLTPLRGADGRRDHRADMAEARPIERTPFFEFQARNRRATWRLTLAYALVVGGCGFVSAVAFARQRVPRPLRARLPSRGAEPRDRRAHAPEPRDGAARGRRSGTWASPRSASWAISRAGCRATGRAIWVIGLLLPLVCWLTVRSVWRAAGVGHTLLAIGARPPAAGDLEERQLVNVVQEMAIAAGIPAPEVRLLDARVANAAAVGMDADRELRGGRPAAPRRVRPRGDRGRSSPTWSARSGTGIFAARPSPLAPLRARAPDRRRPGPVRAVSAPGGLALAHVPLVGRVPVAGVASRAGAGADRAPQRAPAALRRRRRRRRPGRGARPRVLRARGPRPRPHLPAAPRALRPRHGRHRASSSCSRAFPSASSGGAGAISRTRRRSSSPGTRPASIAGSGTWARPAR